MDPVRCGTVPQVSCTRALCTRGLLQLLSSRERDLLYRCFGYQRGAGTEVPHPTLPYPTPHLATTTSYDFIAVCG